MEIKDIEAGNYVRTNMGISKIIGEWSTDDSWEVDKNGHHSNTTFQDYVLLKDILKANSKIIKLIKIGDYVNGKRVERLPLMKYERLDKDKPGLYIVGTECDDEDIKTVVTREQFSSIEYKVVQE